MTGSSSPIPRETAERARDKLMDNFLLPDKWTESSHSSTTIAADKSGEWIILQFHYTGSGDKTGNVFLRSDKAGREAYAVVEEHDVGEVHRIGFSIGRPIGEVIADEIDAECGESKENNNKTGDDKKGGLHPLEELLIEIR